MIRPLQIAAAAALLTLLSPQLSGSALVGPVMAQGSKVNVLEYALSHPSDNARIPTPPQLGDSVPNSVTLQRPDNGNSAYGYFYYAGQPVIVDIKTRAVVRIGG